LLFTDLGLKKGSLKAIQKMGFESPTEIQEKAIPILMKEEIDFVGQAQTGTGKTVAFALPLLEKLDLSIDTVQSLIVSPTRELANQIQQEIVKLTEFAPARSMSVYGGTPVGQQIRDLKRIKPQIIVGTPGRLLDFINREVLDLSKVKYAILDEADEMLDMGFFDDIQTILKKMENKKIWMFSATMPRAIETLIKKHFCHPTFVRVQKKQLTSDAIEQLYVMVKEQFLTEALARYLDYQKNIYAIIFTRTKVGAKELTDKLNARGYATDALHGDMSQDQRDLTMKNFKQKDLKLLVCTDVAARGIDVSELTHVINYQLPQDNEAYVHRIGRTGRGGSKGIALSIISVPEHRRLAEIESITKAPIERVDLPGLSKIRSKLVQKNIEEIKSYVNQDLEDEDLYDSFVHLFESEDKESLIKGLFNYFYAKNLYRYKSAGRIDMKPRPAPVIKATQDGFVRLFTNIGRDDGLQVTDLVKILCDATGLSNRELGKVDFKSTFSFAEIPSDKLDAAVAVTGEMYKNKRISIQKCRPPGETRTKNYSNKREGKSRPQKSGQRSNYSKKY
jgi:ATP-dependent RNA helicase DeaD